MATICRKAESVTVAVGVILTLMFGLIGFSSMPVQLSPTVDRPSITVTTNWSGRSPEEVVDEIAKEQEERLKTIAGLDKMTSTSTQGRCEIALELFVGTNVDRALQEVSDALRQVPEYPEDVDEPTISASGGNADNAITWIIIVRNHHAFGNRHRPARSLRLHGSSPGQGQ